jgi:nitroreductase
MARGPAGRHPRKSLFIRLSPPPFAGYLFDHFPIITPHIPKVVDVLEALRSRRTVRQYFPDYAIPRDILNQIVDLSLDAPTGKNCQEIDLVVVTNRAKLDEITRITLEAFPADRRKAFDDRTTQYGVTNVLTCDASAVFLLYANGRAESEFAQVDAGIISMTIMAAAREFGLQTMCLGALLYGGKAGVEAAVGIPNGSLLMAVALGKPKENPKLLDKKRLAKATIIE